MKLNFGEFLPDLPDHNAPGLVAISNSYPGASGYRPVGAFVAQTTALASACKGAASFVSPSGLSSIIAGTSTNLYRVYSNGFTSIGSGYSIQGDQRWRFAQFGGLAIATNAADAVQKIDLATFTVSALDGAPPKFKILAVVQNFLVGGVLDGDVMTLGWSAENNCEDWAFGNRKSDYNILPDGGDINGILGGEYGLILQRGCVRRMSYVGGNVLFRFDKIASNLGCATVHSVAQYGELGFWYSDSGFQMWDGSQITGIGFEKVDKTFAAQYGVTSWSSMSCAIDGPRNVVCWSMGDKIWLYNWKLAQWSIIDIASEIVFGGFSRTINLDEQDPAVGANDDNLDFAGLVSLDDARFKGGDPLFYMFNASHILGTLSGSNITAYWEPRNAEIIDRRDSRMRRVRPMSDVTGGVTLQMTARQRLGDAGTVKTYTDLRASGEIPVRSRGRFIKPKVTIAASQAWTFMQGVDVELHGGGRR